MELRFIQPGKPVQNAFVESANGKFRDECLNQSWFVSLADAVSSIAVWRLDYNRHRPHSALNNLTSEEFAQRAALTWRILRIPGPGLGVRSPQPIPLCSLVVVLPAVELPTVAWIVVTEAR